MGTGTSCWAESHHPALNTVLCFISYMLLIVLLPQKLTTTSPSCGRLFAGNRFFSSLLWYTVPSCRSTRLCVSLPIGTWLRLAFFVATPTPQMPVGAKDEIIITKLADVLITLSIMETVYNFTSPFKLLSNNSWCRIFSSYGCSMKFQS